MTNLRGFKPKTRFVLKIIKLNIFVIQTKKGKHCSLIAIFSKSIHVLGIRHRFNKLIKFVHDANEYAVLVKFNILCKYTGSRPEHLQLYVMP